MLSKIKGKVFTTLHYSMLRSNVTEMLLLLGVKA